jgi:2-hydroxy-3-oxopropionate reductase
MSSMAINVGFIGLGIMGKPMALNLIKGGYPLRVYGRRAESMAPLVAVAAGARACSSPEEVASAADITFIMVSDTQDVEQVILGPKGVLSGARPGAIVVDMSTISPVATRALAARLMERGVEMLDAPVSGGEAGAVNGTLSLMVGGKPEVFTRVKPLFERMGKKIVHVGPNGAGQATKACNQIAASMTIEGVAEAFTFARRNGVDPARVREALLGGFANSRILEVHGQRMLDHDFRPGFKVRLHQKDLRIVMETAHRMGIALPGSALAAQHLNALIGRGEGELDSSALINVIERLNGMSGSPGETKCGESPSPPPLGKGESAECPGKRNGAEGLPGVGFIGLGVMGKPMALNLIKGGYSLRVYGRRKEAMAPLVETGAIPCGSAEEAALGCDVIFTMVTATRDVQEVILGERGVIAGARPGAIVVDMGTISPAATRAIAARLAEAGIEALDAPVSGGGIGAISGTLSIMVGGKPEIFERVKPLFSCMGKNIVHIGPNSAGQVAKACNQMVMLISLQGLAEAFAFARRNGLDSARVYEALSGGAAQSRILEVLGKRMVERNYDPGIEARLHYKDIQIVLDEAHTLGMALPGTALVTQMFNALIGRGGGNQDSSQLVEVIDAISKPR